MTIWYTVKEDDLLYKIALLHKYEILEDLYQRLVPEKGDRGGPDHLSIYVVTWNNVACHRSQCNHSLIWHPFENDVSFSCPLLPFPQPHWGVFMSLKVERFWPSSTGPNVPPGCNGCCIPKHYSWTLQGWIPKDSSQDVLPEKISGVIWMRTCGQTQKIRLHLFIVLLWLFLFVCFVLPHNNWQIYCISFVFMHSCFSNVLLQIKPLLQQFCLSLFSPINR